MSVCLEAVQNICCLLGQRKQRMPSECIYTVLMRLDNNGSVIGKAAKAD